MAAAAHDIHESFLLSRLWYALGINDIASRYRGSMIGPFWITIATSVFVAGIGFVYAGLMQVPIERYLPWLATGSVIWGFINQTIQESADAFISAGLILRQTAIPLPLFIWRVIWRNLISLAHQTPVIVGVALLFGFFLKIQLPLALLGVGLVVLNVSWVGTVLAILCARFRDLQQVLASIMQLLFFVTPVLWIPNQAKGFSKIVSLNPAAYMLEVIRNPLLGLPASPLSYGILVMAGIAGWLACFLFFSAVRRRIVHYV